jgi:hypothetical protein
MVAIIKKNFHFHIRITLLKKRIKSSLFFSVKKLNSKPIFADIFFFYFDPYSDKMITMMMIN